MTETPSKYTVLYVGDESEKRADFCVEARGWGGGGGDGSDGSGDSDGRGGRVGGVGEGSSAPAVRVESVGDGVEAMAWLKENDSCGPIVIVLDFAMPVLEAFGFLKGLRAEPELAGLPCVLVSPRASDPRIAKVGAAAVVARPVELRQLADAVRGLFPV